jgi:site-specific recombinase XerD
MERRTVTTRTPSAADSSEVMMDPTTALVTPLAELGEQARGYVAQAVAPNTRRAYASDWQRFTAWCQAHQLESLPAAPETVALYLVAHADLRKASTLGRWLVAISQAHRAAGVDSPTATLTVKSVWAGMRRAHGTAQQGKAPAATAELKAMVATCGGDLRGLRDRALLLLGFAGAFRRSELVALQVADVEFTEAGLIVQLARSKTDQEGAGRQVGIPPGQRAETCPLRCLGDWLEASGLVDGPLFRPVDRHGRIGDEALAAQSVALIVKRAALAAGLDAKRYAGHSLRAGLATAAAAAGVEERVIAAQTGHRSMAVLRRYIRHGELFRHNAAGLVGL